MGLFSCLAKCVSELILIGINLILALGGALVLYVGIYMRHTGWVEVIKGYWSPIDGIVTALIVIGSLIIALAVLGSIAALCRWRLGLCLYACVVLLVFILFVVVAVAAFILRHTANDWEDTTYPASSDEESVKENFDQAYCYAQGEYICNQASVSDALTMFVPTLDSSIASLFENMTGGVNTLCDSYLGDYDELSDVCDGCDRAREFKNFSSVVNWANDKCPRTSETLTWCGIFLTTGSANSSSGTAPYSECRTEFLNLVEKYSLWLGIGSIIVCAAAIMIITFACVLRRRPAAARDTNSSYAVELVLIAINCVLALGGALILYVGAFMRHNGWVDVMQGYWTNIDAVVTAFIVVGSVIIGLAILGSIAAVCRWRSGLCTYAIIVLLFLILFVVVAMAAFTMMHKADSWADTTYPADNQEEGVKTNFDQVYCYAQGEYICNEASVSEALAMFAPELNSTIVALFENMTGSVDTLCDDYLSDYSELESLCDGCDTARKYENYTSIVDWANDQCPRTNSTMVWCGKFLASCSTNVTVGTAPYTECRVEFLDLVEDYSLYLGLGSLSIVCASALIIIIFACCLRRKLLDYDHTDTYTSSLGGDLLTPTTVQTRYSKV
ncbi:hypothetical protein JM16_005038 [Phytophthora kernoviae]|uniref:Tetraspanin n=1 Tax=Phytophthora kernoviae TaxID=325452 RepID=A0A8T0LXX7_9STRA|nr:hypothetical protein JM16_005038 [Phytophthora kernoviae]